MCRSWTPTDPALGVTLCERDLSASEAMNSFRPVGLTIGVDLEFLRTDEGGRARPIGGADYPPGGYRPNWGLPGMAPPEQTGGPVLCFADSTACSCVDSHHNSHVSSQSREWPLQHVAWPPHERSLTPSHSGQGSLCLLCGRARFHDAYATYALHALG